MSNDKAGISILRLMGMLLVLWVGATAQEKLPQIAVIPVQGDQDLTPQQLAFITGQLSAELVKTKAFTVLDRGQMEFILKEQGFQQSGACNNSECQVQMGQLLGVENIVAGSLVRFGSKYALRADYIDVASGKVVQSVDYDEVGELEDVYKILCQGVGQKLAKAVRGKKKKAEPVAVLVDTAAVVPAPAVLAQDEVKSAEIPETKVDPQLPSEPAQPLSGKRKVALAIWGGALLGAGAGWYFDGQGKVAADDYDAAIASLNKADADDAFNRIETAQTERNVSYGVSIGMLVIGGVLWFWPQ